MHNPFAGIEALFVDGENVSKYDLATIAALAEVIPKRLVYQCEFAAKAKYPGFERVKVERMGKESVDKVIAMDLVEAWHAGIRSVAMMSNDKDFGGTALELKSRHPEMSIMVICDKRHVSRSYLEQLRKASIRIYSLAPDVELSDFAFQVIGIIHQLVDKGHLNLSQLGGELRNQGVAYKKGKLGRLLQDHGLVSVIQGHWAKITDLVKMCANKGAIRNKITAK